MADADDLVELLFFDTFSHEIHEDLNLDLVQFPKPVYITEIRIIPLGARVQADFPGGVRLGATNPSKFGIQFFVNDLSKPGASTFEILGNLEYNQNDCIHLECQNDKIPTDGLVLRGWYTTITLAVYGTLTNNIAEQIDSPPPPVEVVPEEVTVVPVEITATEPLIPAPQTDIPEDVIPQPVTEIFEREVFPEPQFERNFEQPPYPEDAYYQTSSQDGIREHEPKRNSRRKSRSSERSNSRHRTYSRSDSNDRDYTSRQKREWSRSPEYRHSRRMRRDRSRDIPEHSEREHKWPRTPPSQHVTSPRRPRSPETVDHFSDIGDDSDYKYRQKSKIGVQPPRPIDDESAATTPTPADPPEEIQELAPIDEDTMSQGEQFEPILSDDEIVGDDDNNNDEQENEEMEVEEEFDDIIKVYDPFKTPLARFEYDIQSCCAREIEIFDKLLTKYELQTKTATTEEFLKSSNDEKENFVYISEQLLTHLTQINLSSFDRRNFILKSVFHGWKDRLRSATRILKTALSFECACDQPQPGFKVRHIKIGARLAECLGTSEDFIMHYIKIERCDPFNDLFHLYEQQYMALSIKLLILRAIYANLDTKLGVMTFLNNKLNGYQRIISLLQNNPLTRAKFALTSIVKKIHLYEALESVHDTVTKQFVLAKSDVETPYETLECCFKEVKRALLSEPMNYQQPKRFLPVSEKFEIVKDSNSIKSWAHMMQSFLKIHAFAEALLLILCNHSFVPTTLVDLTLEMLKMLARSPIGIDYLVEDAFETLQIVIKYLLNIENYPSEDSSEDKKVLDEEGDIKEKSNHINRDFDRFQKLGIEISYRIQTHYHMTAIANTKDDTDILTEHLHALYSQMCYTPGRTYTVDALTSLHNNIEPLLHLIEKERKCQAQRNPDSPALKYKSPVLSYSVDLIDCCVRHSNDVRFLAEHESILVDLAKHHEIFESSVSAVLQEMAVFLKPLETGNSFSYDDVTPLCEVIKRSLEYITTFPGDLIMALRILRHLGIADQNTDYDKQTKELKHRYVILQFYSADGVVTIINILEKLNTYFEQPGLHSATLMTSQAVHACQILLPALQILREMLTFVIQCRDAQFKDITAMEHLLKTYALMHYYPELSQAYEEAQNIKAEIVKILLAYTQPNPQDQESVHKSLWTQMIREVIKFILTTPSTFIPGLQIFAELLPLPLPVQTIYPPSEMDTVAARLITERKLWSAHLHPQSGLIAELIQTICPSSFPQLIDLLTRVCLQLADLAPNMTLLVSKTVTDLILSETSSVGTSGTARLLKFLAQLTAYASVKISSLSILAGRLYEFLNQILTNPDKSEQHIQCQLHVHRIYENFFDSEISMIAPNTTENPQLILASVLPSRDLIPGIINSILMNLFNSDLTSEVAIAACRNLIILTEHDITCYHLKATLEAKKQEFQNWLEKVVEASETNVHRGLAGTVVLLIRALMFIDESGPDSFIPNRTIKLTVRELASIIKWTPEAVSTHPLTKLKEQFSKDGDENPNTAYLQDLNIISSLFDKYDPAAESDTKQDIPEPNLPQAEGIITQYVSRPIFTPYEPTEESQLIANYWLEPIRLDTLPEDIISQAERIPCDLNEIVKFCLPPETNLPSDCKRVLHLSASPQSSRERTTTAPCFRTRRVEVEPSTGRPEKKIFVTPMRGRGFPRTPPSRGDLFRSRPPNTSRPPSLHVDDFLALETCGAQPTGPTGYNKISREIINIRGSRVGRNRGSRIPPISSSSSYRTGSPSTWSHDSGVAPPQHFRTATSEPVVSSHFASDPHYSQPHFGGAPIRSRGRGRPRTFIR